MLVKVWTFPSVHVFPKKTRKKLSNKNTFFVCASFKKNDGGSGPFGCFRFVGVEIYQSRETETETGRAVASSITCARDKAWAENFRCCCERRVGPLFSGFVWRSRNMSLSSLCVWLSSDVSVFRFKIHGRQSFSSIERIDTCFH